jgi:hypothetical protein
MHPTDPTRRRSHSSPAHACGHWVLIFSLVIGAGLFFTLPLFSQTSDPQSGDTKSWTDTTESQRDNVNPTRTTESHTQTGNRTLDNQSLQRRGPDGRFVPYQDIERVTVRVDAQTVRTTTRTFGRDSDGAKTLVQVTEEENRTLPDGGSNLTRSTSNPDANGRLQLVQRDIAETKKVSANVEETKTTVMLAGSEGGLAPAMKLEERRKKDDNGTIETKKSTLLPDASGKWQVSEVRQSTIRPDGNGRSIDERISRPNDEGKLGEVTRTVTRESGSASEKRDTVETYSVDVPGAARDNGLHLVERTTTARSTTSTGQQSTKQQVERPDPGDPDLGLRVSVVTTDTVTPGSSGALETRTVQTRDADGRLDVVSVDMTKSDSNHAVQVQIAPPAPEKKK